MKNKYFYYTLNYILLYKTMYNKSVCCHYTSSYIMTTNTFNIHESVYHVILLLPHDNNIGCV